MKKKYIIKNSFFDLIAFVLSFCCSFFRSFKILFTKKRIKKKNIFFKFFDFIFRIWPKYFWKIPSLYKISSFFSDILNFIFYKKNDVENK